MGTRNLSQLDRALFGLRSLVMGGEFDEGQRLSEVSLAKQLGTSRTPLRQAMDRLVAEGLLERIRTGGCRVATFSIGDIADAIELRGVIEGTAARMAAERGVDAGLLAQAQDALDQIDGALSAVDGLEFDQYVKQNARFHSLLAQFPASPLVEREIERMSLLPLASPSAFLSDQAMIPDFQDSLRYAQRQHRAILDAIINKEGARAEALTREHARLALINFNYLNENRLPVAGKLPGIGLVGSK
ncbi:MAG: GntR family transcriptional regulator [Sulfitobacter sp.]